jgi:hypothetical protein
VKAFEGNAGGYMFCGKVIFSDIFCGGQKETVVPFFRDDVVN